MWFVCFVLFTWKRSSHPHSPIFLCEYISYSDDFGGNEHTENYSDLTFKLKLKWIRYLYVYQYKSELNQEKSLCVCVYVCDRFPMWCVCRCLMVTLFAAIMQKKRDRICCCAKNQSNTHCIQHNSYDVVMLIRIM